MPKLIHAAPKYSYHKASKQAVVTIQGRDIYLGPWQSKASKLEYDRLIGEWLAAGRQAPVRPGDVGTSIMELAAGYWDFAKANYVKDGKPTGQLAGIKIALRFLKKQYGHTLAANFGPLALKAIRDQMIDKRHSRGYINQNIDRIRRCFKWGVANEIVPVAVYHALLTVSGLRKGKTEAREPEPIMPVPADVVEATLPHLPAVVADMVRLQGLVGCRPGELCSIRPCDVDTSSEVWCYVPESHKTEYHGRERRIFIGPRAQEILRPYLLRPHDAYCFSPAESEKGRREEQRENRKTKVQPSQRDRSKKKPKRTPRDRYTKDSYCRAIVRVCARLAGLKEPRRPVTTGTTPGKTKQQIKQEMEKYRAECAVYRAKLAEVSWHPNQLRHVVGTRVRKQYGVEAAQVVLGHSKADVTQVYAERDFELARRVVGDVG